MNTSNSADGQLRPFQIAELHRACLYLPISPMRRIIAGLIIACTGMDPTKDNYLKSHVSQGYLAAHAGCTTEAVRLAFRELEKFGFTFQQRWNKKTSVATVDPFALIQFGKQAKATRESDPNVDWGCPTSDPNLAWNSSTLDPNAGWDQTESNPNANGRPTPTQVGAYLVSLDLVSRREDQKRTSSADTATATTATHDATTINDATSALTVERVRTMITQDVDLARITTSADVDAVAHEYLANSDKIDVAKTIRDAGNYLRTDAGKKLCNGRDHLLRRLGWAIDNASRWKPRQVPTSTHALVDLAQHPELMPPMQQGARFRR